MCIYLSSVMQLAAVCCSVSQCVAVCYSVLQRVACSVLSEKTYRCVSIYMRPRVTSCIDVRLYIPEDVCISIYITCRVLQCIAACCKCVVVCCSVLQ